MDHAIQSYLRTAVSGAARDVEQVGPFLATFARGVDHPMLSYAIPDDGARPAPADVAALIEAFRRRGRVPRLEYLPAVAPEAEAVLVAGGFEVEGRLPLMVCAPESLVDLEPPGGIEIVPARTDDDLAAGLAVAHAAFSEPGKPDPGSVPRARRQLEAGALAVLARESDGDNVVGWGQATIPRAGTTEIVGIAVLESHRRRGIAGAVTARVTREAFGRGVTTAFLTPGDEGAERVYARAGFRPRSVMLHLRVS